MADTKKTILIVEDEETLLQMYQIKFESSGFNFLGVTTGEAGLNVVKNQKPNIILVDLILKNKAEGGYLDGFTVIAKLKKNLDLKGIPIYALSNLNQDSNIQKAKKAGADGYLVKSDATPRELVDSVNKILAGEKVGIKL
ncbi:response regulator [Patescibacteria group bacterium]|nr:response regulator [Patescibacteria group bacterium]